MNKSKGICGSCIFHSLLSNKEVEGEEREEEGVEEEVFKNGFEGKRFIRICGREDVDNDEEIEG